MVDAGLPQDISDLAHSCVLSVQRALNIPLDFTPDTLPLLDHYLRQARGERREQIVELIAPMAGAYFGETVRRQLGPCRWAMTTTGDYASYRLEFEQVFLTFNPMGVALEALLHEPAEGFGAHFVVLPEHERAVKEALDMGLSVSEEDFYRLSVRLETIEQVTALLVEMSSPTTPQFFGAEVYAALREHAPTKTLH